MAAMGTNLDVLVHLENIGDQNYVNDVWAGTAGESRRLEGFQIDIVNQVPGVSCEYMAHLQDSGDTPWVQEGAYVGTRGQSRRLEGFAIKLKGPQAGQYSVRYKAHLQDTGNTAWCADGAFCGTRGQSRRVEAMLVEIDPR
jgi:uncharacterized protein YjdB